MKGQLTAGFRDLIEMRWSELVEMEQSLDITNYESAITAIVRSCRKGNLRAIQMGLDRLDGKIATEIEAEYPKFYYLYPQATMTADDTSIIDVELNEDTKLLEDSGYVDQPIELAPADMDELAATEEELPTGSLRRVLERMLPAPKQLVTDILASAEAVDKGDLSQGDPMVKSVIVAGLMKLIHDGRISAVFEVFDQIDGKVAEKIKVLGDDVFVTRFDVIAPAGAEKNADGIYQVVADNMTNVWAARLELGKKGGR